MVRYADDFVVLCRTADVARAGLDEVSAWVHPNGLTLHPDKTHVGNCLEEGKASTLWAIASRRGGAG